MRNMEKEDIHDGGEVISSYGCEDLAPTALTIKEEMYSEESSDVKHDNTTERVLVTSNENVLRPKLDKLAESENDMRSPFLFVGIKTEMPDDYESEASCKNLEIQCSSEEYSKYHEREYEGVGESSPMILNSSSYVQVKMESVEDNESEFDLQINDDVSIRTDTHRTFDTRSEEQGCDMGHSSEEFIIGMECREYPIMQVKEEGKPGDKKIAVNRNNSAIGGNVGALNSEEEKEPNKTLDEAATELNPVNNYNPSKGKGFSCNVSHPIFEEDINLEQLPQSEKSQNPLSCFICKKFFRERISLEKHMRYHSAAKSHSCKVCDARFSSKSDVRRHMRSHTGEKPFTCDICQKSFSLKEGLKIHSRIHTGEKPFSCNICQKLFSFKSCLKRHVLSHTSEKRFTCNLCQKTFTAKSSVDAHMRIHTGEKPFACHICKRSFSHRKLLKSHTATHTGEKPFSCDVCSSLFSRKSSLRKHIRRIHLR